jgi:hypothetical protein
VPGRWVEFDHSVAIAAEKHAIHDDRTAAAEATARKEAIAESGGRRSVCGAQN